MLLSKLTIGSADNRVKAIVVIHRGITHATRKTGKNEGTSVK